MSFKPNPAQAPCPTLPGMGLLRVAGRDAAAFLQAQSMNDVTALAPARWHWNGLLTPKGRVIALFALLREADDQFLLVTPDVDATVLQQHLRRFVFRSKLVLQVLEDWHACAGPAPGANEAALAHGNPAEGWALDFSGAGVARGLWLLPAGHPAVAAPDPATTLAWARQDLAHGLPRLPPEQSEAWTPQMLSLARLAAYSLKKGCYPGQEIVSRTHYLGTAKRGLARLHAELAPVAGSIVRDADGRELGTVVSSAGDELLAVLPAEPGPGPFSADGRDLALRDLLDGLAR